jgi:hypothetical protein
MQVGTKVIRKSDFNHACKIFGEIESINGRKAYVMWKLPMSRTSHSNIALSSLLEVTPEREQDLADRIKIIREERERKWLEDRPYLCTNVNPLARVSNDGHKAPMRLMEGQVKDGKCWYCKAEVQLVN